MDLAHLPPDDPAVYRGAAEGRHHRHVPGGEPRADGVPAAHAARRSFYDIVVQVAIIRPGPIVGKMVHPYLKRRQGREPADCLHPSLEPVLRRTLGVPLFQEQLLRMAMIAAGFTGGEAEELRRAMGFKRSEKRMARYRSEAARGHGRATASPARRRTRSCTSITSFALYGFPESHAASFALIAYASAYLKCHYLAAFTCAMLNNQPMGFYSPGDPDQRRAAARPARAAGGRARDSEWECTRRSRAERALPAPGPALRARACAKRPASAIVRARAPFTSVDDLAVRVPRAAQGRDQPAGGDRRAEFARPAAPPRRALAGAARDPAGRARCSSRWKRPASPRRSRAMNTEERLWADYRGTG